MEFYPGVREARLSIEVTTRCNIACSHCFVRAGISEHSSLSTDIVKDIVAEGYNTGYCHLHITGGEPVLWEGLLVALDDAFDRGYKTIFMNTNGTLLTKDVSNRLAAYNGLAISVSLEGTETLHDYLRGEGSYRRTIQGIEKALDAGIDLTIFTIVRKSLLPELPYFADDLYKKFPLVSYLALIQLIRVKDDIFDLSEELLEPEDFLQMIQTVSLLNLSGLKSYVLNDPLAAFVAKLLQMPWVPQARPLYSEGSMIVMANRSMGLSHS
jgi:MoaA/NifB/PqqE/SkfB family radical SAM enzyme